MEQGERETMGEMTDRPVRAPGRVRAIVRDRVQIEPLAEDQVSARLYGQRFSTAGPGTPRPEPSERGTGAHAPMVGISLGDIRARLSELADELEAREIESAATERALADIVRDLRALAGGTASDREDPGLRLRAL